MSLTSPLGLASLSVVILLATAFCSVLLARSQRLLVYFAFILSALAALIAAYAGFQSVLYGLTETMKLPIGLPDLPFYMRLDPLSGFFVTVVALLSLFVSIYSIGYVKGFIGVRSVTPLVVFYCIFIAGMLLVLLSDDAYFFMISWELMAASSFFLVCFEDERGQTRRAAFVYLLIAHVGAIFILLSFGVLAGSAAGFENFSGYTFSAMRGAHIPAFWASAAFLMAFFGFAAKAGVVPLHIWLPDAHPAAPSNVSALMSGVMLKVAIYAVIRVTFDILHVGAWWWGGIVLILGLISAVMGILYALVQVDLKRLLAYSSVENVGIIMISLGLAMILAYFKLNVLAALALAAGLYHSLNHAMFKGLLFMGAGSVLHATHERNMEGMGGLIHKMPWTSALFLVGSLSIAAMPPFNGFVSEWLLFQTFLLSPVLPGQVLNLLVPLGAAVLALTAALSARCFVKVFGVVFLGHYRGTHEAGAHEVNWPMRAGMTLAASACLFLGVSPVFVIGWLDTVPAGLTGAALNASAGAFGWLWLTPVAAQRASYSAPIVLLGIAALVAVVYLLFHARKAAVHRGPIWDCGFEKTTNRMQYNSTSFAMPLRRIFAYFFMLRESVKMGAGAASPVFPRRLFYHLKIRDRLWYIFYEPVAQMSFWLAKRVGRLQHGKIQIYLLYSFVTLILLLVFA